MASQQSIAFQNLPIPLKLMTASSAACFADFLSFPLDTAKVRLQVQGEMKGPIKWIPALTFTGEVITLPHSPQTLRYNGLVGTIGTIAREEGPRGLYNGLNAGLQRQMCFASVRLGMYEPMKAVYRKILRVKEGNGGPLDVMSRIMAGMSTGAMAVMIAQPTEVVKVRFQAQAKAPKDSGKARYSGTWQAYKSIYKSEGTFGLWKGAFPNIGRNVIVTVAEVVCYDLVKDSIIRNGLMSDNIPCHFASATIAGFCATVCASPVDVVKTRYMNAAKGTYAGAIDCAFQTAAREGLGAFYKGFLPSFSRLASWNIIMWISYEQLKKVVTTTYYKDDDE